jgi:protein-disulfide isomerase
MLTRRDFVVGTGALTLAAAGLASAFAPERWSLITPAAAQTPSASDLAKAGPLEEMALGPENAPVTIIEYASMTCSHCANFSTKTFPELKKRYIDTGKVRYILREFPLDPLAAGAFMLARCAGKNKYYPMVETLFEQQKDWVVQRPLDPLKRIAKQAGFTDQSFDQCLANQQLLDGMEKVRQHGAEKLGVNSTPTFFINGKVHRGDISIDELEKQIQPYLKG